MSEYRNIHAVIDNYHEGAFPVIAICPTHEAAEEYIADRIRILNEIAAVSSLDFAEQAAGALDPRKHLYGFEAYLILLYNLKDLLYAGMPDSLALESVQCGYDAETILTMWRLSKV